MGERFQSRERPPERGSAYNTRQGQNTKGICPASIGAKDQQPASYDPQTGYFIVPTNHWCEDYQPFAVKYKAGFPYVGAIVKMYRGPGDYGGALIAWDPDSGKIVWSDHEHFPAWSGVLTTDGGVAFYGTMDGWFKAVSTKDGSLLFKQKMPSGMISSPSRLNTVTTNTSRCSTASVAGPALDLQRD